MKILKQRKFLGPTQFASALGYDYYVTTQQLLQEFKEGYQFQSNPAMQYGLDHEAVAIYYYQKLFKVKITTPSFVIDPKNPRIGGIADGLIIDANGISDTGIEIKCHMKDEPLTHLPYKYLLQMAGYMYLYRKNRWILLSCVFRPDHTLSKYRIFTVTWDQVKNRWDRDWYPIITEFTKKI